MREQELKPRKNAQAMASQKRPNARLLLRCCDLVLFRDEGSSGRCSSPVFFSVAYPDIVWIWRLHKMASSDNGLELILRQCNNVERHVL